METNVIETVLAQVDELKDGETKECDVGESKVLLIKENGVFSAVAGKCPHYGAPLKNGVYYKGRVRCPWHGASFNTSTGDIEDYPTAGCLPTYTIRVDAGKVILHTTSEFLSKRHITKPLSVKKEGDDRLFVILGGGPAGCVAAETLRTEGYTGRIVLIERYKLLPYDRTKLSKQLDAAPVLLKTEEFFKVAGVEVMLGVDVVSLDADAKSVTLSDGLVLKYTKALIATGANAQRLAFIPGHDGKNVYTLRTNEDAAKINAAVDGKTVVIIGSSFVGMEVTACIIKRARSVTVVGMEAVPFERVLGPVIGEIMQKFHESQGVKFVMKAVSKEFTKSEDGNVHQVVLNNGTTLPADIVIIGAGALPATSYVKESSCIKKEKDGSIILDQHLFTGADGLYGAGDIARYPLPIIDNQLTRIEHWGVALTQGAVAAKNMAADTNKASFINVPVFWTAQYGKSFRYAGHALFYDKVILDTNGENIDPTNPKLAAYYSNKDKIVAVFTVQRDPLAAQVAEILTANIPLHGSEIEKAIESNKSSNSLISSKLLY